MSHGVKAFSLLELLMALFIFSIGLLGLLKLISLSSLVSQKTLWRSLGQNELLNGYEIIQSENQGIWHQWQQELSEVLPRANIQLTSHQITLTWHQPEVQRIILKY